MYVCVGRRVKRVRRGRRMSDTFKDGLVISRFGKTWLVLNWWSVDHMNELQPNVCVLLDEECRLLRGRLNYFELGIAAATSLAYIVDACTETTNDIVEREATWKRDPSEDIEVIVPRANFCSFCGRENVTLKLCSNCKRSMYCSRRCQANHYRFHKNLCTCDDEAQEPPEQLLHHAISMFSASFM